MVLGIVTLNCNVVQSNEQYFDSYEYELVDLTTVGYNVEMETFYGMNSSIYFNVTNNQNYSVYVNVTSYNSSFLTFLPTEAYIPVNGSKMFYAIINTSYIYDTNTDVTFNVTNSTNNYTETRERTINIDVYKAPFVPWTTLRIIDIRQNYTYYNYVDYIQYEFLNNNTEDYELYPQGDNTTVMTLNAPREIDTEDGYYGGDFEFEQNRSFNIRLAPNAVGDNQTVYFNFSVHSQAHGIDYEL